MAYSHDVKSIWLNPIRTSTRSCHEIQRLFNFTDLGHSMTVTEKGKDFYIILNVRNPYSRLISIYYWECNSLKLIPNDFNGWVKKIINNDSEISSRQLSLTNIIKRLPKEPNYYVRVENLEYDIRNIPFIKEQMNEKIELVIQESILTNRYKNEFGERPPLSSFYDNDLYEIVYNSLKEDFLFFNYKKL